MSSCRAPAYSVPDPATMIGVLAAPSRCIISWIKAGSGWARGLGVGFRHEARPAFVAVGDELYLLGFAHTIQDGCKTFARNVEHVAHALIAQTVHNGVAAIHTVCFGCGWHCFPR